MPRAWISYEPGMALQLAEVKLPATGEHGVRVRMRSTGVCHSQIRQMMLQRHPPRTLGHEGLGRVIEVGALVTDVAVGDDVVVTWLQRPTAGHSEPDSFPVQLPDGSTAAVESCGTWAEEIVVDGMFVIRLTAEQASHPGLALVGCAVPTGVGAATKVAEVSPGDNVVIVGIGGVGACAVVGAAASQASQVVAVDVDDSKLDLARSLGATDTVNSTRTDPVGWVYRHMRRGGDYHQGADVVIDCVGLESTILQAVAMTRPGRSGVHAGGRVVLVGMSSEFATLPVMDMGQNHRSLLTATAGGCTSADLLELVRWCNDGILNLDHLVTSKFTFDEIPKAVSELDVGRIRGRAIACMY